MISDVIIRSQEAFEVLEVHKCGPGPRKTRFLLRKWESNDDKDKCARINRAFFYWIILRRKIKLFIKKRLLWEKYDDSLLSLESCEFV